MQTITLTPNDFERMDNDINGNPRYYVPVYHFVMNPDRDILDGRYYIPDALRLKAGLTKYRGKKYGAGYVVQSYNLDSTINHIIETLTK